MDRAFGIIKPLCPPELSGSGCIPVNACVEKYSFLLPALHGVEDSGVVSLAIESVKHRVQQAGCNRLPAPATAPPLDIDPFKVAFPRIRMHSCAVRLITSRRPTPVALPNHACRALFRLMFDTLHSPSIAFQKRKCSASVSELGGREDAGVDRRRIGNDTVSNHAVEIGQHVRPAFAAREGREESAVYLQRRGDTADVSRLVENLRRPFPLLGASTPVFRFRFV